MTSNNRLALARFAAMTAHDGRRALADRLPSAAWFGLSARCADLARAAQPGGDLVQQAALAAADLGHTAARQGR